MKTKPSCTSSWDAIWVTRDGTEIRVCDMSYAHLKNAIAWLRDRIEDLMHAEACEEWPIWPEQPVIYHIMVAEQERRIRLCTR